MDISKFSNIRALVYSSADNTTINIVADIDGVGAAISFTASANDHEKYGQDIYANAAAGEYGVVAAYIPPPPLTQSEIVSQNTATQKRLLSDAAISAFPLQSALVYGGATAEQVHTLEELQMYSVALMAVNLSVMPAAWPTPPQGII
ncbi:virus tail fiber assembly protein lambda gpK [Buttiauxella sp. JUb87]|uniref:tail fiber assembly protein n=1 Tax=Buttiauxella sp. JUb87 TaxID=2485129 RepID=UPI00105C91C3|nr:tail fiber assembly protein [Buttiauxella sp. JUb87]TDN54624.1 virus tail fiber assembly protein lambda gpK [Buttiauxella sp. JUb87]